MVATASGAHWIEVGGVRIEVAVEAVVDAAVELGGAAGFDEPAARSARLRITADGESLLDEPARAGVHRARAGSVVVTVIVGWGARIVRATLEGPRPATDPAAGPDVRVSMSIPAGTARRRASPLHAPPGTRRARIEAWSAAHPALYASRHVAVAAGRVVLAVVGVSVLLRALLPRIDWARLPSIDLPTGWLQAAGQRVVAIVEWIWRPVDRLLGLLPDLPDWSLPGWLRAVVSSWRWWGPILFAIVAARRELRHRRARQQAEAEPAGAAAEQVVDESTEEVVDGAHR